MKVYPRKHDRQLILQILCGVKDELITKGTEALEAKAKARGLESHTLTVRVSELIDSRPAQDAAYNKAAEPFYASFAKFTIYSRLYLAGHGFWKQQTLGGLGAKTVAYLVAGREKERTPKEVTFLVSVLGCESARDKDSAVYGMLGSSVDSFAANLHRALKEQYGLAVNLFARVYDVGIAVAGEVGRKGVYTEGAAVPSSIEGAYPNSKVLYRWFSDKQARYMVNYVGKSFDRIDT
jgi:hypothetical protein